MTTAVCTSQNARQVGRNLRRALGLATLAGALALLAACAQTPEAPPSSGGVVTPSEETDERRRARIRLELAEAYYAQGQVTVALDEIQQALSIDPGLPAAHNMRGLILDSLNDETAALQSFERALQLAPNDGDALHNLGWFHCKRGRYPAAAALFDRALAVPTYREIAKTWFVRGVCELRSGDLAGAERSLQRAHEIEPGNPATSYSLADLLMRRGELERARFYIRRVNTNPDFVNAQSLWLQARIEHRAGNLALATDLGQQLRGRFPRSREAAQFERGAFNE